MTQRRVDEVRAWLQTHPSLAELREAYPAEWETVERDIAAVVRAGDIDSAKTYILELSKTRAAPRAERRARGHQDLLSQEIRRQMATAAMRQWALSAATGVTEGRLRFNLLNGYVAQKLLFKQDLERKPVSLLWFRLLWPLLWQRRFLMPLVGPKGIYCFYSRRLIRRLAVMIGDRTASRSPQATGRSRGSSPVKA